MNLYRQVIPNNATTNAGGTQQVGVTRIVNIANTPPRNATGVMAGGINITGASPHPSPGSRPQNPKVVLATSPKLVRTSIGNVFVTPMSSSSQPQMQSVSPVRKRLKLELETSEKPDILDAGGYRRRIIEHKMRRMPALREKYVDTLSELFFLQSGGNMMDYHNWQKRPPIPQYLHFLRQHRLDPDDDNEDLTKPLSSISEFSQLSTVTTAAATTTTTTTITSIAVADFSTTTALATTTVTSTINSSVQSQNTEVKISGVGVTPVAISTTLPAAVAQLNQQGKFLSISLASAILIVVKKEAVSERN